MEHALNRHVVTLDCSCKYGMDARVQIFSPENGKYAVLVAGEHKFSFLASSDVIATVAAIINLQTGYSLNPVGWVEYE